MAVIPRKPRNLVAAYSWDNTYNWK